MSRFYTEEHRQWIFCNQKKFTEYGELTAAFNKQFNCDKSIHALQQFATKKCGVHLNTAKTNTHYTQEQEDYLAKNFCKCSGYAELTAAFNEKFCDCRSVSQISDKCSKGLKLTGMNNVTRCAKGNIKEQCQIGTLRKGRNGTTYIKVVDSRNSHASGYREPWWLPIQKKIYQDAYGEVPQGKMVIFLNGNTEDLSIDNLYAIDRRISAILAKNGWYFHDAERTLTAIKWCELYYKLKEGRVK